MLELVNLSKRFEDGTLAVDDVSLKVVPGEIFVLLGANGAGKTTTINLILGFTEPTKGDALINGVSISKDPLEAKKYVAFVSENVMVYGNFTARQNLEFFTKLGGRKKVGEEEYERTLLRVGLAKDDHRKRVKGFSKGMRQRLGIAIAIMKNAKVVLLDEPTSGLDPEGGREFIGILRSLKEEDKAILMTSHDIFRSKQIADRVGIMNRGRIIRIIPRDDFEKANLEELYFKYVEAEEVALTKEI